MELTLGQKQRLFARNFAKLILWSFDNGYEVTVGEVFRTPEQHAYNLAHGKSKAKISQHMMRLAGDLNLFVSGVYQTTTLPYKKLGEYWVSLHTLNRWGGDFNKDGDKTTNDSWDGNHFEMQ